MFYQILNGDSLACIFPGTQTGGEIIVAREGFIDGDLRGNDQHGFWKARADYMGIPYAEYYKTVAAEFEKILAAPDGSEFNLWFEYDLFCQVNMWYVISLIAELPVGKIVYVVYTSFLDKKDKNFWNGYGTAATTDQLIQSFHNRILLSDADIQLGQDLWKAYKNGHLAELKSLAKKQSPRFPYLQQVIEAHLDRFPENGEKSRPEKVLEDIMATHSTDFHVVFQEFWNRESIYGFGDIQLKHLYDKVKHSSFER